MYRRSRSAGSEVILMTKVEVYNQEANELEELAEKYETTTAEIVEAMMIALDANEVDFREYL